MTETATPDAPATEQATDNKSTGTPDQITWDNSPIAKVYNPDGTPKTEAASALAELGKEDLAKYALRNGQDFFTALKTGRDATAFASQKTEGMVKLPGEDASDEDRAEFNKSLGALESAEDYAKNLWPDELPEGFQKDEKLASLISEHAAKSPVMTAESVKELAGKFIEHQQAQQQAAEEKFMQESEEQAKKVADNMTVELGGTAAYEKFSTDMKEMLASPEMADLGFEFQRTEDNKITTENPLHAAMLNDPAMLRFIKERLDANKPAGIPSNQPMSGGTGQSARQQARQFYAEKAANGGFKSTEDLKMYQSLLERAEREGN